MALTLFVISLVTAIVATLVLATIEYTVNSLRLTLTQLMKIFVFCWVIDSLLLGAGVAVSRLIGT